ncbi:hypothetical protein Fcan01_14361 [Folsomia candida]|uniref:Uncharacterized protein n=1 Tax=Folsomia candida TaxID=158441 RepID=A0A226E2P3_FOLCA|nr:hypothetical protein Fcan01_14361 [Folsomia candida]
MGLTNWFLYFCVLQIDVLQACICPMEWKYGLPAQICGKEIAAVNNDHTCQPQAIYVCTELGGVGSVKFEKDCLGLNFCEMILTRMCKTEECCKEERQKRGCEYAVDYSRKMVNTKLLLYFWLLEISKLQACTCPKEWKYGIPAEICGKKINAINNEHACEPQYVYNCTELGGVVIPDPKMSCKISRHYFCEMKYSLTCKTEECCKRDRLRRGCADDVATIPLRHLTLGKPGQPSQSFPISSSSRKCIYGLSKGPYTFSVKFHIVKACICPKEWKYGLPAEICGKEIIAINKDHSCEPQFVYTCTELGGSRNSSPRNEL